MSINRVFMTGNLTRDPELKETAGGVSILGFCVAVNDRKKNQQSGEWEDVPNFIDCTIFGHNAEFWGKYLTKGSKVAVEGKLRWSSWEKDGQRRTKLDVVADSIESLSQRDGNSNGRQQRPQRQQKTHQYDYDDSFEAEDLPFN